MPIKLSLTVLLPIVRATFSREKVAKKNLYVWLGVMAWGSSFLPLLTFPVLAVETEVLGVVRSEENASNWQTITKRLQASGINYCVIDLASVRSATDLSDRPVVFLPNVETISPAQAIASTPVIGVLILGVINSLGANLSNGSSEAGVIKPVSTLELTTALGGFIFGLTLTLFEFVATVPLQFFGFTVVFAADTWT